MSNNRFEYLLNRFITKSISEEEKIALAIYLLNKGNAKTIEELVEKEWDNTTTDHAMSEEKATAIIDSILNNDASEKEENEKPGKVVRLFYWKKIAVAAIFILGVFTIYKYNSQKPPVENKLVENKVPANDIAPGGNKAILQLADGSTIILDSSNNGNIANQGQTKIIKIDGQLAYNADGFSKEILYNTISTPRGGQYQLILADGTKVWLNAASSLRFPTNFIGNERKVTLTGEGYFEVAKNTNMPFKVDVAGKGEVEVLGTHFNINSYTNELSINTTLLEGSVKVKGIKSNRSLLLSPGQQAEMSSNGKIILNSKPDINEVIAWKNGLFEFNETDINSIMRQIERWYDVDVEFEDKVTQHFNGTIQRQVNASKVLGMLEKTGGVRFLVNGRKVIVKKY